MIPIGQAQPKIHKGGAPWNNIFYALHARYKMKETTNMVNGMLKDIDFDVYTFLGLSKNLSLLTPFLDIMFGLSPEIVRESFSIYTHVVSLLCPKESIGVVLFQSCISPTM